MTVFGERPAPARIRELRRAIFMFGLLFVLWWIAEFLNFAGRIGIDPLDVTGAAISAAGGWLRPASMAGAMSPLRNRFFINSGLPLGFHLSSECPYCGQSLPALSGSGVGLIHCGSDSDFPCGSRRRHNRFVLAANEVEL